MTRPVRGSSPSRALVFDMDGTLIESSVVVPDAYISTIRSLGGRPIERTDVIAAYSLGPPAALLTHFLERSITSEELDTYHSVLGEMAHGARPYAGISDALSSLHDKGVRLAVFTGATVRACRILLGRAGLLSFFDVLVGGDEVPHHKPAPDGIHLACKRLGVAPGRAAYVGDAPTDLEAARRSGALAVAAGWGHLFRAEEEDADEVLHDPGDLLRLADFT